MSKSSMLWLTVVAAALSSVGCVSQVQHDNLNKLYRTQVEENERLKAELRQLQAMVRALQDSQSQEQVRLAQDLASARMRIEELEAALDDAQKALMLAGSGPLPRALDDELRRLAEAYPGLMTYDSQLGMIRFSSDLTFDSGSDVVNAQAREGLGRLAAILNGQASGYQVQVVGHTDNVPIRHVADKHPTNWHLSVHRAISVMRVLAQANVAEQRFKVAGRGEFEPVEPNGPSGSRANRRVEIFLVGRPAGASGPAGAAPDATAAPAPAQTAPDEPADAFK